jgi:hypothetical protein
VLYSKGKLFTKGKITAGFDQPKEKKSKKSKVVSDNTFSEFLKTLQKPAAKDLVQHLKLFHRQITDRNDTATVEEQSEAVQDFYTVRCLRYLAVTSLHCSPPSPPSFSFPNSR